MGWVVLATFIVAWFGAIIVFVRKEQSATVAIGGGFLAACLITAVVALMIKEMATPPRASQAGNATFAGSTATTSSSVANQKSDDELYAEVDEALKKLKLPPQLPQCFDQLVADKIKIKLNARSVETNSNVRFVGLRDISERSYNAEVGMRVCWGNLVTTRRERAVRFDITWADDQKQDIGVVWRSVFD